MATKDELEDDQGPIVFRRRVYEAGVNLEAEEAASGWTSFDAAEAKMDELKAAARDERSEERSGQRR